jgi:hypothetical protein
MLTKLENEELKQGVKISNVTHMGALILNGLLPFWHILKPYQFFNSW